MPVSLMLFVQVAVALGMFFGLSSFCALSLSGGSIGAASRPFPISWFQSPDPYHVLYKTHVEGGTIVHKMIQR